MKCHPQIVHFGVKLATSLIKPWKKSATFLALLLTHCAVIEKCACAMQWHSLGHHRKSYHTNLTQWGIMTQKPKLFIYATQPLKWLSYFAFFCNFCTPLLCMVIGLGSLLPYFVLHISPNNRGSLLLAVRKDKWSSDQAILSEKIAKFICLTELLAY